MKNHLWLGKAQLLCLASAVALFGAENRASAQDGQGSYVTQASARLIKLIDAANKQGYSLQDNSFSIGGGWLKQGADKWVVLYTIPLQEGKNYRFVAAGDADAKDVDLEVVDSSGKVVAQDVKDDPEAIVDYTPTSSGRYTVRIRLYASANNVPCVCLAVVLGKN
jgi:hypothetical protein